MFVSNSELYVVTINGIDYTLTIRDAMAIVIMILQRLLGVEFSVGTVKIHVQG